MFILPLGYGANGQQWDEIPLPPRIQFMKTSGNPLSTGTIALWGLRPTVNDTAARMYVTPWALFATTNAGGSWMSLDSGFFSRSVDPPLMTNWHQLVFVGNTMIRSMYTMTSPDNVSYQYSRSDNDGPFLQEAYPGPVNLETGSPVIHISGQGTALNLRHGWGQDSTVVALYRNDGPGGLWTIMPDSLTGFHPMPTPTVLGVRSRSYSIMFLGTRTGLYMTGNGGLSWTNLRTGTSLDRSTIGLVTIHPRESNLVYATGRSMFGEAYDHLYRSTDYGLKWIEVLTDTLFTHLALSESSPASVLVGTQSALFASPDTGTTWRRVTGNLPMLIGRNALQSLIIDPVTGAAFAALPSSLHRCDSWSIPTRIESPSAQRNPAPGMELFPNPCGTSSGITIRVSGPDQDGASIRIVDALGRECWSKDNIAIGADHPVSFIIPSETVARFPSIFFVMLESSSFRLVRRCTVIR